MNSYLLDAPGIPDPDYQPGDAFLSQAGEESHVVPEDLNERSVRRLLNLGPAFDRFRGIPDAGTNYFVDCFFEKPARPEKHRWGWTYLVAYYHLDRDVIWSDESMCLRAVLDENGDFIDLRYGFKSVDGTMTWVDLRRA